MISIRGTLHGEFSDENTIYANDSIQKSMKNSDSKEVNRIKWVTQASDRSSYKTEYFPDTPISYYDANYIYCKTNATRK